jgi:uncharacterized SAM-binding protein YcdF (DUF218 family)
MSFVMAKIAWLVLNPANLLFALMVIGALCLWLGAPKLGRRVITFSLVITMLVMIFPLGSWMLRALEDRFPRQPLPENVAGIIVLGGSSQPGLARDRGVLALNGSVERLHGFARLARRYPKAVLVFTGGSGDPFDQTHREADAAGPVLLEMGIPKSRLILERNSRNTFENAILTRKLLGDRAGGRWILVTSASHMPRAIGAFRRAGWDVTAFPVDYQTYRKHRWIAFQGPHGALGLLGRGLHEWLGLVWYWLNDRTNSLFPGPEE